MANFKCDSVEIDIPNDSVGIVKGWVESRDKQISSLTEELKNLNTKLDSLNAVKTDVDKELTTTKASLEATQVKLDSATEELAKVKENTYTLDSLKARRQLERVALTVLQSKDSNFKVDSLDSLSDRDLKEAVIKVKLPTLSDVKTDSLDKVSAIELDAYYKVASENVTLDSSNEKSTKPLENVLSNAIKTDSYHLDAETEAVRKSAERAENAYKITLGIK